MGSHRINRNHACVGFLLFVLGGLCALIPFGQKISAASIPPVGTVWEKVVQTNPGEPGELNVRWSVKLESANTQTVSLRYTFQGEVGFITDQVCNSPSSIPLPWDRLAVRATLSGGGPSAPATFTDESLANAKLDFQAPTFVNCWAMVNPPPAYPSAVSYVRYSGYRFSAIHSGIPTEFFSKLSTAGLSVTNNSSPAASNFVGTSISIPVIGVDAETTTTKPKTTTTQAGKSANSDGNAVGVSSTTILSEVVGSTIPTEDSLPVSIAESDGGVMAVDVEVVGAPYDLETETPVQEQKRKEDMASSLAVTAAVLISSLAAAAPALGAVSAAGAIGGVIGVTTARSFSGGQILPQVPTPSETAVEKSKSSSLKKPKDLPVQTSPTDVVLENSFATPNTVSSAKGATRGVSLGHVGRLFAYVISGLQNLSRLHMFRPGLRRWAEVALVNPALAAMLPLAIFSCSVVLALMRTEGMITSTVTMLCLFSLSIFAPVFSLFAVIGWCVGRMLFSSGTFAMSVSEAVALLPGLLFLPMMLRNLIGPRTRSHSWEHVLALVLAPCVAALAYRNWILHFSDVADSLSKKISSTFSWDVGDRVLGETSELVSLGLGLFMAIFVLLVAVAAVRFADDHGQPKLMFRRFVQEENPTQVLRRAYVDLATVELGEPARWGRWMRYGIAGLLSTYALSEVLGMKSIVLVLVFLSGVAFANKSKRLLFQNEVHPIVKTIPMVGVGLVLGAISVSSNRVFFSFAIVAVLAVISSVVRTRSLWDA
jgi:hypothetical protein